MAPPCVCCATSTALLSTSTSTWAKEPPLLPTALLTKLWKPSAPSTAASSVTPPSSSTLPRPPTYPASRIAPCQPPAEADGLKVATVVAVISAALVGISGMVDLPFQAFLVVGQCGLPVRLTCGEQPMKATQPTVSCQVGFSVESPCKIYICLFTFFLLYLQARFVYTQCVHNISFPSQSWCGRDATSNIYICYECDDKNVYKKVFFFKRNAQDELLDE